MYFYCVGNRVGALGRHTKRGGYIMDSTKIPFYVVPDLEGCELKPYVSHKTEKITAVITEGSFAA